jgi:predicted O-linked N-acetylglucosamine transferase (SPINDLY family)
MTIASPSPTTSVDLSIDAAVAEVRRVLAALREKPASDALVKELRGYIRTTAQGVAAMRTGDKAGSLVREAFALISECREAGFSDWPVPSEEVVLADQLRNKGWPGLVASMLLVPAWQSPKALPIDDVPSWMWGEYTKWALSIPQRFVFVGQAEEAASRYTKHLEVIASWGARNRGSATVKQALNAFLESGSPAVLLQAPGSLRRLAEARMKALKAALGVAPQTDVLPMDRTGRRLRVGFVHSQLELDASTFALLPWFGQLDKDRFEVALFVESSVDTAAEDLCRVSGWEFQVLPVALEQKAEVIRGSNLDVLVFGDNLVDALAGSAALALHRLAPLQVALTATPITSGSPEIDLYLTGEYTERKGAAEDYSERLGLIPCTADVRDFDLDKTQPTTEWNRSAVGIPDEAVIFISTTDFRKIGPEVQERWASILAATPGARLVLHPFSCAADCSAHAKAFASCFDRLLQSRGIADDRLAILTEPFVSRADVKEFLKIGDVFLDTFPVSGTGSVMDALETGLPVVTLQGSEARSRRAASLLNAINLDEGVADDENTYETLAVRLATNAGDRKVMTEKIREKLVHTPVFKDSLVASEMLGFVVEKAFDLLVQSGRNDFRRQRTPIDVSPLNSVAPEMLNAVEAATLDLCRNPKSWTARLAMGNALREAGRIAHAVKYLLAALEGGEAHAPLWHDLAMALRDDGKRNQAIEALETCLRIDPKQGDVWVMAIELAESSGAMEIAREMVNALRANVPDHPQTAFIAARLGC